MMNRKLQKLLASERELEAKFEKADVEHTAQSERVRQTANARWELQKQLRAVRAQSSLESLESSEPDEEVVVAEP